MPICKQQRLAWHGDDTSRQWKGKCVWKGLQLFKTESLRFVFVYLPGAFYCQSAAAAAAAGLLWKRGGKGIWKGLSRWKRSRPANCLRPPQADTLRGLTSFHCGTREAALSRLQLVSAAASRPSSLTEPAALALPTERRPLFKQQMHVRDLWLASSEQALGHPHSWAELQRLRTSSATWCSMWTPEGRAGG